MGVPWLAHNLQPFAQTGVLSGQTVVIDGPSLAYHIYYVCLTLQPRARNPFESVPSYHVIGETAIAFLDQLQYDGAKIKKIYFDGFLPTSKMQTRSNRLLNYTKQLSSYHEAWPQIVPSMQTSEVSLKTCPVLFGPKSVSSLFTKIPAAPFLVPAIIEKLSQSTKYCGLMQVVPGEADLYCARYLSSHGGTVLTSDSDLLVHDLGSEGMVSLFKDVDIIETQSGTALRGINYRPAEIVERLGLGEIHGLKSLAFEMKVEPHASFAQHLQRAIGLRAVVDQRLLYQEFIAEYLPLDSDEGSVSPESKTLLETLRRLDPRISEFVLQFKEFANVVHRRITEESHDGSKPPDVFLPFLLDCPLRTSAWEMSTAVRQLAYGLINLALLHQVSSVVEHRRQQRGSKGREWQLPTLEEIPDACNVLVDLLADIRKALPTSGNSDIWRAIACHQEISYAQDTSKPSIISAFAVQAVKTRQPNVSRITWDGIHIYAQLQGSYYSFRILKQIMQVIMVSNHTLAISEPINLLYKELQTLPLLSEFPTMAETVTELGSIKTATLLNFIEKLLDIEKPEASVDRRAESGLTKKERKKRKRAQSAMQSGAEPKRTTNRFEFLSSD